MTTKQEDINIGILIAMISIIVITMISAVELKYSYELENSCVVGWYTEKKVCSVVEGETYISWTTSFGKKCNATFICHNGEAIK